MRKALLIITGMIIMNISCERDVHNIILPDFVQKLVIHSFISSYDSTSLVTVNSNQRIYGDLSKTETPGNVSVAISNGEKEVSLRKVISGYIFTHKVMPIEEGKTYRLTVTSDNGLYAEATCTVPISRDFHLEADTLHENEEIPDLGRYSMIRINAYLTDYPGEANYFRFASKYKIYDSKYPDWPIMEPSGEEPEFISDKGRDGERIFFNTTRVSDPSENDSAFLVIYLLNTDKEYYTYHKSLENYSGGEDPFREVSPLYSNIEGGLGIFASYVVDSLVLRLK
jgi:Domain of unknown function (DUF4249)